MLIRTTAPVAAASGKQGTDIVYFSWRGAQCARDYARPQNPNTPRQIAVRNALALITKRWQTLTKANRDGWTTYAGNNKIVNRLGVEIAPTALGAYLGINSLKYLLAGTYQDTAPIGTAPPPPTGITALELEAGATLVVNVAHRALQASERLVVYLSVPASPAVRLSESAMSIATYPAADSAGTNSPGTTSTSIALPLDELNFSPAVGQLVHIGVRMLSAEYQPSRMLIEPVTISAI